MPLSVLTQQSLAEFNTFGMEVTAPYFLRIHSLSDVQALLNDAVYASMPRLFLGSGSNILFTKDPEGLVIKNELKGISVLSQDQDTVWVEAASGELWHDLVLYCIAQGWSGLENLSLIPGTVGAAPMQNIGAYGVEIKDVFDHLTALDLSDASLHQFDLEACQFGYRESYFKRAGKDRYFIASVCFRLQKKPMNRLSYGAISSTLAEWGIEHPSIKQVSDAVIHIRQSKLPDPKHIGNAGSFFKNPSIPEAQADALKALHPDMPVYPSAPGWTKIAAGWLIEQAGWKGHRRAEVGVHERQALVLVNYGKGKGSEIKALAEAIQASIMERFGIALETEVNIR